MGLPLLMASMSFKKEIRKILVKLHNIFLRAAHILILATTVYLPTELLYTTYKFLYAFLTIYIKNIELINYVCLSIGLISFEPLMKIMLKVLRLQLFNKYNNVIEIQQLIADFVNVIILRVNKIPIKGCIHILNLVILISSNFNKILENSYEFTYVYMAIATYYAMDKILEYFSKKYETVFENLDNRLFHTDEINKSINIKLEDVNKFTKRIFDHYISTGRYEMPSE